MAEKGTDHSLTYPILRDEGRYGSTICVKFCRSGRKTLANDFVSRYNIVMRSIAQTTAFDIRRII